MTTSKSKALDSKKEDHKHSYYLKNSGSFSKPNYHRECNTCGHKAKTTKYKMDI